jgi:hypothetical protein
VVPHQLQNFIMKKTLFLSAFAAGTLIRFALACFLLTSIPLHSFSQHQFCGEYVKPIQADPAKWKVLYDRFGNAHSIEELKPNESIDKSLTCNSAGFFDITYVGSFTMDEQNTICEALMYISALISPANGGGNVNLEIKKASLPNGVLAVGTPYFNTASCGIQEPTITEKLVGGVPNSSYDGTVTFNTQFNSNWHTLSEDPCNYSEFDFYTIFLHEMGHVLGILSRILDNGTPGGGYYSTYDSFLRGVQNPSPAIHKLILPTSQPSCPDEHEFNTTDFSGADLPDDFMQSCSGGSAIDIGFETSSGFPPIGSPGLGGSTSFYNYLSHLDEACAGETYVMNATISAEAEKRFFHQHELEILESLGYSIVSPPSPPILCAIDLNFDNQPYTVQIGETITIPLSTITFNDVIPANSVLFVNAGFDDCADPSNWDDYVDFSYDEINEVFVITGQQSTLGLNGSQGYANLHLCYAISCDGKNCDYAYIIVNVLPQYPSVPPCQSDCNLVCHGNFDGFSSYASSYY